MNPRFDAYTATMRGVPAPELFGLAVRCGGTGDRMRQSAGYHGFERKLGLRAEDGAEWASVLYGGERHGDLVMIEVKGERTPEVVGHLREAYPHRCTRVDSAADFDEAEAFERLLGAVLDVKRQYRLRGERRGDWDFPEDGRTQYLGAASSTVRARLYEKGKQPEYRYAGRPNWVRCEVQVRPEKDAKASYAAASATQVWGASPFTRDLAARVLELQVPALSAYAARSFSERERALRWMCEQYGSHLVSLKYDLGDWQSVGLTLGEMITEQRSKKHKRRA